MKIGRCALVAFMLFFVVLSGASRDLQPKLPMKQVLELLAVSEVLVDRNHPGSADNKYGYEGGCAVKLDGVYHIFTAERFADPGIVKMRLGHWTSADGENFQRVGTLFESTGTMTGDDPYASIWSPMPVFDHKNDRWQFFYVAYRAKNNDESGWYLNHLGRIWRVESEVKGLKGIGGPYKNVEVIMEPGEESEPWEGLQGVDSFYPYRVGEQWYAFYGSAQTQRDPNPDYPGHCVGIATAPRLDAPKWTRLGLEVNPVIMNHRFVENPVVTQLPSGEYIALFDSGNAIGYSVSPDGINWSQAAFLPVKEKAAKRWWSALRTPLGLVNEGDGTYTIFFTAYTGWSIADGIGQDAYASIGKLTVKLLKQ